MYECFKIKMQSLDSINITTQTDTLLPIYHCPKWVTWLSPTSTRWENLVGGTAKSSGRVGETWRGEELGANNSIHQKPQFSLFFLQVGMLPLCYPSFSTGAARHKREATSVSHDLLWSPCTAFPGILKLWCMMWLLVRLVTMQILSPIFKFIKS